MESDRRTYGGWMAVERAGWEGRRKVVGWLNAGLGLVIVTVGGGAAVLLGGRADLPALILVILGVGLPQCVAGVGFALGRRWSVLVLWVISFLMLLILPIGTLLGGYTLWVLYQTRDWTHASTRGLAIASAVMVPLVVLVGFAALQSGPARSPVEREMLAAIAAQGGTREFSDWWRGLPRDTGGAFAAVTQLAQRGLLRLPEEDQLERARLMTDVLGRASTADCAAVARGRATRERMQALVESLDSTGLRRLTDLMARALLAELRSAGIPTPAADSDVQAYVDLLYDSLPEPDRGRLDLALDTSGRASDADACWFIRMLYARALEPHPSRARWLRVISTLESGPAR
jgi:hypothetical protein